MFKVDCPGCKAPYQVDERRVPPTGLGMRCPKCGTSFKVDRPEEAPAAPARPPAPDAPMAAAPAPPGPPPPRVHKPTMVGVAPAALGAIGTKPGAAPPGAPRPAAPARPALPLPTLPRPGTALPRPAAGRTVLGVAPPRGGSPAPNAAAAGAAGDGDLEPPARRGIDLARGAAGAAPPGGEDDDQADLPAVVAASTPAVVGAPPPPPRRRRREELPELADVSNERPPAASSLDEDELDIPSLGAPAEVRRAPPDASLKATVPLGTAAVGGAALGLSASTPGAGDADADLPIAAPPRRAAPRAPAAADWDSAVPDGGLDLPAPLGAARAGSGAIPDADLPALPAVPSLGFGGGDGDLPALPGAAGDLDLPAPAAGPGGPRRGTVAAGELDLPALGGAGGRGMADLPALPDDLDLPALGDVVGLPELGERAALPALPGPGASGTSSVGLPALADGGLPEVGAVGLPALGGVGLPLVGAVGLPALGGSDLPAPAGAAPAATDEFELPSPGGFDAPEPEVGRGVGLSSPPALDGAGGSALEAFGGSDFPGPAGYGLAGAVDPFAASVPPPPGASLPAAPRASEAPVIRQADGGTGYGEVNLGGDDTGEAPIEAGGLAGGDEGPDDMEFGGVPQEDAKAGGEDAAVHVRMAIGAKIAPAGVPEAKKRRGLRYLVAALVLVVAGGGALSLTAYGPFGWYYLEGILRGSEHQKLLESTILEARRALAQDTYPEARRALKEIQAAREAAKRVPGIAAYAVFVAAMYELRFGEDAEANARAKVTLEELAKVKDAPYLELARAGNEAVTGQLARASSAVERLARQRSRDIDVLVLRGEVALLGNKPPEAVAAWEAAAAAEASARTAFGQARAAYAAGKPADAERYARTAIERSPSHVGARILLARIAWTTHEDEAAAMKLLEEAAKQPDAASVPEQVLLNTLSGDIHLQRSRISLAEAAFGRALKLNPKAAGALRGLGEALFQAGRFSEALARFEAGTKADPDLLEVQVGVAKTLLSLERFEDAMPMLRKLDEKHPKRFEVAFWLGAVLEAVGKRDEAESAYRRAIVLGGADAQVVQAYTRLAMLLAGKGQGDAGRQLLDEAAQKLPKSPALFKALGELALQQGGYDEALRHFAKARSLAPDDVGSLFLIGVTQRRQRAFEAALETFDKVAEIDRDYPGLALERGLVFESAGRGEDALKAYEAALAKAPDDVDLKLRVGCGKASAGRGADAEKLLREVLSERPASAETNYCLGRAILAKGVDVTLALRHLERATDLDPHRAEYHLYVGLAALEAGRILQAQSALKRALELDQSLADAYWQRGVLRYRQGQVKDAVADLERALELRPSRYEAHAALADAYLDLQQEERAVAEWGKAIENDPDNALWRFRYGKLLAARSQFDAAQQQLAKAIELAGATKPSPAWLWEAHMLLARSLGSSPQAVDHWVEYLRACPQDNPYKGEAKAALKRLGKPWEDD